MLRELCKGNYVEKRALGDELKNNSKAKNIKNPILGLVSESLF